MMHCQYILNTSSKEHELDLNLFYCGKESCSPNYTWVPNLKDRFLIHFIHSGKGTFYVNGTTYSLGPNEGFLIYPKDMAHYTADGESPWTYSWIEFNGKLAEEYLNQIGLCEDHRIFFSKEETLLQNAFQQLFDACKLNRNHDLLILSCLYHLLAMIDEPSYSNCPPENPLHPKDFYIQQALLFIDKNYTRDLSITEIAEYLKLNRNYMTKIFKEAVGVTPKTYLINYRIRKAAALMNNSYLTISEISTMVGYSDPLLFSRMFKKVIGLSPRAYRNRLL
ncbi:AraC family transcriptional regulator [Clostridium cellulovorans]|uniref:Transcriptional regulator, AraC family n=1 Tax=Clostridium cellulovorans (strain ATCC 35296 / DSM 3052 / OCM 3 / 743B) TaxID=573061 RepID=D9SWN9_CLOC7|nr:AraC family transcriptional regulator [Clostridium cellulovorans]ADL53321.1 transcriptional regulator, AraC family [Clostridium cellulovorans 743B]